MLSIVRSIRSQFSIWCLICLLLAVFNSWSAANTWEGDASQFWGDPNNWSTGQIPDGNDNVIVGAPAPAVIDSNLGFINGAASTLVVSSLGEIEIDGGRNLQISGGLLDNDGVITVNSNIATGNATLRLQGGGTISGTGEIVLAEPTGASLLNSAIGTMTHAASHIIRGEGQISGALINHGTITAEDINGDLTGELLISGGGTQTNNGVIQSSATASVNIQTDISHDPNESGKIIADTQRVILNNRRFVGGTFESKNGGIFESTGNTLRFDGVHLAGELNMTNPGGTVGTLTVQSDGFANDGLVRLGPSAPGASIVFANNTSIDGNGEILMLFEGLGSRIRTNVGVVGTLGAGQTVRGVGQIDAELVNNGKIIAQPENGNVLELISSVDPKTNNALLQADPNAILRIRSTTVHQNDPNGRIVANEGIVQLNSGTVVGGRLLANGAGRFEIQGTSISGRLENVILEAPFDVPSGATLNLGGSTLQNNNTIAINSNSGAGFATMNITSDVTLTGSGEILLNRPSSGSRIVVSSGQTFIQSPSHTIRGKGQYNGPGAFINNGLVEGTSSAEPFEVNGTIGGDGTLKHVRIDGTHAPGESTASVMIEGAYTINNFATLAIEIGGTTAGTEFDQLLSNDPNNQINILSGGSKLNVSLVDLGNSYVPAAGDRFTIIGSTNAISGGFQFVNLPEIGLGRQIAWAPVDVSDPNKLVLEIAAVDFFDADFDEDGDVDNVDLSLWEAAYASTAVGDANDDGRSDGLDFLIWQEQFGLGVPAPFVAAISAVPEPTSVVLMGLGCLLNGRRRR